jgi:hypothetical protein
MRRVWSRPELIVIVRGKPEEAVLWACKDNGNAIGVGQLLNGCYGLGAVGQCEACSAVVGS